MGYERWGLPGHGSVNFGWGRWFTPLSTPGPGPSRLHVALGRLWRGDQTNACPYFWVYVPLRATAVSEYPYSLVLGNVDELRPFVSRIEIALEWND